MAWFGKEPYELAIVGNDFEAGREELNQYYLPKVFLFGGKVEGKLPVLKIN
ncbi:MAG: hypothetical protein K9H49_10650 [Bacteroidales bacterium]|nr:hypothetical protein [Bacteroidales bacterium]MCF8391096.1 hypothetical protein [Bacteroidales bacterium]